jgi:iron complex outermembrane recepter protein
MSKFRIRKLGAVCIPALASSVLTTASLVAQTAPSTSSTTDEPQKLEKFEITGSRVKRVDAETVSPVTVLKTDSLALTGFSSVADALRALPFNSGQALTPTDSGNSFTPGVNAFNLRGLGNNNTLVLINGRRAVPYAVPGFNGLQTVFDLNSIPDAAIDSIEILKDGGSAIYGSDAVAGVVNFKLRHDYQGLYTSVEIGDYFRTGGLLRKGSFMAGARSGSTSIMVAGSWSQQDAVYARDISYSADADKTNIAGNTDAHYTVAGFAPGYTSLQQYLDENGLTDPVSDGFFDNRSSRGYPGRVVVGGKTRTFASPTSTPTVADSVGGTNYYNFQQDTGLFPQTRNYSFYTSLRHDFNESLYAFAELSYTRVDTLSDAAPTPVDLASEHGLTPDVSMTIPSYNAYNPWGVDITSGSRRLNETGNRVNDVTSDTPRILVGLGGALPDAGIFQGWTWETGAMYMKNSVANKNRGSVSDYGMQQALNGLTRRGDGSLTWDPNTPQADRVYFNWFGTNDPAFSEFLEIENPVTASLQYEQFDVSASGTIFDLPAGKIGLAVGAEHRNEKMEFVQTDLNKTGNIVGGSQGTSAFGNRRVNSFYAEAEIPATKWLDFQLAGRYEKYSDKGFDADIHPKVGVKIKPLSWMIIRASYAESFKAPDLAYLYTGASTNFTSNLYVDPVTGNSEQLEIRSSGNPDLQPETTKTYYAGIVVEPQSGPLKGLSASFDYFLYKQRDLLAQLTDFYNYSEFLSRAAAGDPLFASKVVRDPASNRVLYISDDYNNISTAKNSGFDVELTYRWDTNRFGQFLFSAAGTYLEKYEIDGSDIAGGSLNARVNANFGVRWKYHDWEAGAFTLYRGKRHGSYDIGAFTDPDIDEAFIEYTLKPQYTVNLHVSYSGLWNTKVTVGVNNAFDSAPPVDPLEPSGSTPGVNNLEPSFWYVRLEKQF